MKSNLIRVLLGLLAGGTVAVNLCGYSYIINDRQPAPNGTGLPIKWPAGSVAFQIKLGTDKVLLDGTNYSTSTQGAIAAWNAVLGNLQLTSQITTGTGTHGRPTDGSPRANEIVFAGDVYGQAFEGSAIAVTTTWSAGNDRVESDIVFNTAYVWDSYRGGSRATSSLGPYDLQRVAIHEIGHSLGLDHPDKATPPQQVTAIMNSRISNLDSLASDDILGAQNLYGPPGAPLNDNFANATPLVLSNNAVTVTGFTTNASKQTGEPNHAGNPSGHSVWWRWSAPSAGSVVLDTRGSYSDTVLAVYTGGSLTGLSSVASNDDIQSGVIQASSVTFTATAGTTYYFAVDGFDGDTSGVTLNLAFTSTGPALPVITSQPVSTSITVGGTAAFTVVATGATSYQWFKDGVAVGGATGANHTISNVALSHSGSYFVTVTNNAGSINSDTVTLTVTTPPTPVPPPSSGGGKKGGGGAPSFWFYGALSLLAGARGLGLIRRSRLQHR